MLRKKDETRAFAGSRSLQNRYDPRLPNLYRARAIVYKSKGNAQLAQADELRAAQIERGQ